MIGRLRDDPRRPRLGLLSRLRKLLRGVAAWRLLNRRTKEKRRTAMKNVLRVLRTCYKLSDATHNVADAWKMPTSKTASLAVVKKFGTGLANGEIHPRAWQRVLRFLKRVLKSLKGEFFVDLGSGTGKITMQTAIDVPNCASSTGVEIFQPRHAVAVDAHTELRQILPNIADKISFILGDVCTVDISSATFVLLPNKVFQKDINTAILHKLNTLPHLRVVVCMEEVCKTHRPGGCAMRGDPCVDFRANFALAWQEQIEVSWAKGANLCVYLRRTAC
jgi:hypothetical protein